MGTDHFDIDAIDESPEQIEGEHVDDSTGILIESHSLPPPDDNNCDAMQSNVASSIESNKSTQTLDTTMVVFDERQHHLQYHNQHQHHHHKPEAQVPPNESSTNNDHGYDIASSPMPVDQANSSETPPYATVYNDQIDDQCEDNDMTDTYYDDMCASRTADDAISDDGRHDGNDADTSDMDDENCEKPGDFEDDCEVDTHMGIRTNGPNNGIAYGDSDISVAATYNGHFLDSNRKTIYTGNIILACTPTTPHNSHYIWFFHLITILTI